MTEMKITQAVPKYDTNRNLYDENELLFQNTLKEYMEIFGGVSHHDVGLSKSVCISFNLAKEHNSLTNAQVNSFYLQNYILNKKNIEKKAKRSNRKNQLMRSIQIINYYLDTNQIYHLVEIGLEDLSLKRFVQECYIDFQILRQNKLSSFPAPISITDAMHLENLRDHTNYSFKVLEKK